MAKYFVTTVTYDILSKHEDVSCVPLTDLAEMVLFGAVIVSKTENSVKEVSPESMTTLLVKADQDPEVFKLNIDGTER